jgi:hypothetical protein
LLTSDCVHVFMLFLLYHAVQTVGSLSSECLLVVTQINIHYLPCFLDNNHILT